jgi:hypothetical protein
MSKLIDMLELRHVLIDQYGYSLVDLDEMTDYEIQMTSMVAINMDKKRREE